MSEEKRDIEDGAIETRDGDVGCYSQELEIRGLPKPVADVFYVVTERMFDILSERGRQDVVFPHNLAEDPETGHSICDGLCINKATLVK